MNSLGLYIIPILFMRDSERNSQHKAAVADNETSHGAYDNKGLQPAYE